MKSLQDILKESLRIGICDEVKIFACESLRIGINDDPYQYHPTTQEELRQIIEDRYEEFGQGTEKDPVDFNDIDVSGMTTFFDESRDIGIFDGTRFKYINVSDWDVSNVINMRHLFYYCDSLISIGDISKWNVLNVEDMYDMFFDCYELEYIGDLSNWNMSNVKKIVGMFDGCKKLKSVGDLSKWDVSNVEDMRWMFDNSGITNIPKWYKI